MTDETRNRLDDAVVRYADALVAPLPGSSADRLRVRLVEEHGSDLGPVLYKARMEAQAEARRKVEELKAGLAAAKKELAGLEQTGRDALAPFEADLQRANEAVYQAGAALEAQRVRNSAVTMPVQSRILELVRELNRPDAKFEELSRRDAWKYTGKGPEPAREISHSVAVLNTNWGYVGPGAEPARETYNVTKVSLPK